MKKDIIIVALNLKKEGSGFDTRVRMECEYLSSEYNVIILTPYNVKGISWMNKYTIERFGPTRVNVPKIRLLFYIRLLRRKLKQLINKYPEAIIYCESLIPLIYSWPVLKKRSNKLVYDCHGAQPAEKIYRNPGYRGRLSGKMLFLLEQKALKRCDLIITVTHKQYDLFSTTVPYVKFPMVPANVFYDNISYRDTVRKDMGIQNRTQVYVYSGGVDKWQMCEETIAIYKSIEVANNESFLLILSKQTENFKKLAQKYNIKNYVVISSSFEDVPKYLDASDFGFCIREDNIVNKVASPTKILEYLSRDVKPIITDCIGDFSGELKAMDLACVIDIKDLKLDTITKSQSFNGRDFVKRIQVQYVKAYLDALRNL